MTFNEFFILASALDPMTDQCPVLVKRKSLRNLERLNPLAARLNSIFFRNRNEVSITRKIIFAIDPQRNQDKFILLCLYWGFPTNMHGICGKLFRSMNAIRTLLDRITRQLEFTVEEFSRDIYPIMKGCYGLGMSFFSKLFYFCRLRIDGFPCLILDSFVYKGLGSVEDEKMTTIQCASKGYNNSWRPYIRYIQRMQAIVNQQQNSTVRGEQLEYALFLSGKRER